MHFTVAALTFLFVIVAMSKAELHFGNDGNEGEDGSMASLVRAKRYYRERGPVDVQRTSISISPYGRETIRTTNVVRPGYGR